MRKVIAAGAAGTAASALLLAVPPAGAGGAGYTLITLTSTEEQVPGGLSPESGVSDDGRYVAYTTQAPMVPRDNYRYEDVYVRDRKRGETVRVTAPVGGGRITAPPYGVGISGNGRYVTFQSSSDNLDPARRFPPGYTHVYRHDLVGHATTMIDLAVGGGVSDGESGPAVATADGSHVAFSSTSTDLVADDPNGSDPDVFVRDMQTGTTKRIARDGYLQDISADGTVVAYESCASDLVPGDTNGQCDLFTTVVATGATTRINLRTTGQQAPSGSYATHPRISGDGRYVAFTTDAPLAPGDDPADLPLYAAEDIYVRDRVAGTTTRLTAGNAILPDISADGSTVVHVSVQSGQVTVRDLTPGGVPGERRAPTGLAARGSYPAISGTGRFVTFATDEVLVPRDTNGSLDIYLRDRG